MKDVSFRSSVQRSAACAGLALILPVASLAAEPSEYLWDGAVARGATIEIVNPNGDVFVQRSENGRVAIHALRSAVTGDPSLVEIRTARTDAGLAICSEAPSATFDCVAGAKGASPAANYRVDELVEVPAGVSVVVRGQNGKIVVEDGANATAANGEVRVSIGADVTKAQVFVARNGAVVPA